MREQERRRERKRDAEKEKEEGNRIESCRVPNITQD